MSKYKVIKSLNWLNEVDIFTFEKYEDAMLFVNANHDYIENEFCVETSSEYELEVYQWDIEHDQHTSKYRSFFMDYYNGKIDWEFEIIETK